MRRVTDLDGTLWRVDVSWTDRRFGSHFRKFLERRRGPKVNARVDSDEPDAGSRWQWLDFLDVISVDIPAVIAIVVVVAVLVALIIVFPWLPVLLLDVVELVFFPVLAAVIIGWRVMRRRPFTITASRDGSELAQWRVVGVRAARRVERAVAEAIEAGGDPTTLFPDVATS